MGTNGLVMLAWTDFVGLTRVRAVPRTLIDRRMRFVLGWAMAGQALTPFEDIADNSWGPMNEVRQVPVPETETVIDLWDDAPPLHMFLCDGLIAEGTPWAACPRGFLSRTLADFASETGLTVATSYEQEFQLSGPGFAPGPPFTLEALRLGAAFADQCVAALDQANVDVQTFEPEYGVGQFEFACAPTAGVAAADRAVIAREAVREVARRHGMRASFTPKPTLDAVGNGLHLHLSLRDAADRPATFDADRPGELSEVAGRFAAGILHHMPALCAFTAASPISYLRLGPHHWSSGYVALGVHNREASLRICPGPDSDPAARSEAFNLEYRPADGTANPYLALAVLVRAGLDGIRREWPAPPLVSRDPDGLSAEERQRLNVVPLPETLTDALSALDRDHVVRRWFPAELRKNYINVKNAEIDLVAQNGLPKMCERYRLAY